MSLPESSEVATSPDAEIERLGDEIANLAAHLHAATYRLLVLIREFDERKGWRWGFRSCAHWLSWRTGIAPGSAREKVRVAGALASLPRISEAMSRGELSYSRVRAMTRIATPENEGDLVNVARHTTAAHMERLVRAWRLVDRLEDAQAEQQRHQNRSLQLFPDHDGNWVIKGRLDPEVGALLRKALEWASEALYQRRTSADSGSGNSSPIAAPPDDPGAAATPAQRRADALGLLAERALAEQPQVEPPPAEQAPHEQASAGPPLTEQASADQTPAEPGPVSSGSGESSCFDPGEGTHSLPLGRADRFQVVLHVGADTLEKPAATYEDATTNAPAETFSQPTRGCTDVPPHSSAWFAEGDMGVSAEASRRLSCDAGIVEMHHGPDGDILDVGRKRRTVPPAIRRALEHRDGGCRFPGCGCRFTDAHHITHWADGGATKLDNLILLCRRHHRALHEEGFRVEVVESERLRGEGVGRARAGPGGIADDGFRRTGGGSGERGRLKSGSGRGPGSDRPQVRFLRPDGRVIPEVPEPPRIPCDPVTAMVQTHTAAGVEPDPQTPTPRWHGDSLDVSLALDMLRR